MLRLLLFPILLLVSTAAMAQGFTPWNPFPHKQITMWQKPDGSHDLHYNDSMRVNGNVKEHFFGLEQYMKDIHDCDTAFYRVYADGYFPTVQQPYRPSIDSLTSEGDVIWRFANPNRHFELRTHEQLNASWGFRFVNGNVFDSISMTVINIDTASFLGYFDSLKTIRMETFRQGIATGSFWDYKISRSAGMVQYIPFEQIIRNQTPETWSVMGFDHANGGHYGFTSSFEDYYSHFAPGDQYKWYYYANSSPVTGGISYSGQRMDSIVAVVRDVNGVTLTIQVDGGGGASGIGTVTRNILKSESVKSLFSRKLNTFVNIFPDSLPYKYMHRIFSETFTLDTVNFTAITQENLYSNIACIANGCVECLSKESYVRGLGLVRYIGGRGWGSPEYGQLIGYQKAGQAPVGDMSPLSSLGIVTSNPFRLFPNPANNAVYLEGVSENALVQVFDIHGKLMLSTTYALGAAIPTTDLNDGVYLIRVNDGGQLNVAKLVVSK